MAAPWDLVIVGAGLTGALLLDKVRRLCPGVRVLLVDRAAPAAGATGGSAGVCLPLADVPGRAPLVGPATAYIAERRWREAGLVRPIEAWFVLRHDTFSGFSRAWLGRPLEPVGHAALARLRERLPDLRFEPDELVVRSAADCQVVDAAGLTRALLDEHLAAPGTEFWDGCEVRAVEQVAGGVELTSGGGRRIRARTAALATGGWRTPWPEAGGPPPAPAVKRMVALRVDPPDGEPFPLVDFIDDQVFLLPQPHGPLTVSFRRDDYAADGVRLDTTITDEDLAEGRAALARRSVTLATAVVGARAGYDGYPPDGVPTVTTRAAGRVVHIGGMGGSGVRLGPAVADQAAGPLVSALRPAEVLS